MLSTQGSTAVRGRWTGELSVGRKILTGRLPVRSGGDGCQKASRPVREPCGTIWPNGEFGLGYAPQVESLEAIQGERGGFHSVEALRAAVGRLGAEPGTPLDLTSLPNSHKQANRPESYGRKGLSGYGGKMVRNAGYMLQHRYGRRRLTFLTLTLPELDKSDAVRVAQAWPELTRKLLQQLSRLLTRRGLPSAIVSVTEIQPSRFEAGGCSVLHLHAVFVGRRRGKTWAISPNEVRAWWLKAINRVAETEVSSGSACDMKPVKKDAGNYLSKYMSKGSELIEGYAERLGWKSVPRQWWNMTKAMRSAVRSACLRGQASMKLLDAWVYSYYHQDCQELFKFCKAIEVEATSKQSFVVGFWGKLSDSGLEELRDLTGVLKSD